MADEPMRATIELARGPLSNWCKQAVLFALMVRARDLGKPIPDQHADLSFAYAEEVFQKVIAQAGPSETYETQSAWMTAVVDGVFRWVQNHLDR